MEIVAEAAAARFWAKVAKGDPDACWEWQAARKKRSGYGIFNLAGKCVMAHRVAFILSGGQLTVGEPNVLHDCDNPPCCNPRHLHRGDQRRNVAEAFERGRMRRDGDFHPQRKLSAEKVAEIRARLSVATVRTRDGRGRYVMEATLSKVAVAEEYGVSLGTIYDVLAGETWT